MRTALGIAALACVAGLLPARVAAQTAPAAPAPAKGGGAACQVAGVWELVSVTDGGKEQPMNGYRQRKILSQGHYMWIGADAKRDTIALRTLTDSLRASRVSGGTGTYTVSGNRYTEQLTIFVDPTMEGQPFPATCRTEGDRWYHTFPADSSRQTVEVWRRIR